MQNTLRCTAACKLLDCSNMVSDEDDCVELDFSDEDDEEYICLVES